MPKQLSAVQLRWIHKAHELADIVVSEKRELFETIYRDTTNPKTHVQIARTLLGDALIGENESFAKNIITFAGQKLFGIEAYKELQKQRREKFNLTHAATIGQDTINTIMEDARKKIMTDFTSKDRRKRRQTGWKNRGFVPWDIAYIDMMILPNPYYHLRHDTNSFLDLIKIAAALNATFHKGKYIRTPAKISSFLQKREHREKSATDFAKDDK